MNEHKKDQEFYDYYEYLVRYIANRMMDPHRYFEQKLMGEMRLSSAIAEENALLATVLKWLEGDLLSEQQVAVLGNSLLTNALPSLDFARTYPDALRQLLVADGPDESLQAILDGANLLPGDRRLIEKRLAKN